MWVVSFSQLLPCVKHRLPLRLQEEESHQATMSRLSPQVERRRHRYLHLQNLVLFLYECSCQFRQNGNKLLCSTNVARFLTQSEFDHSVDAVGVSLWVVQGEP